MMGLPLRLLAREVYDRVSARVGEQAVALVTGEEKRVPPRPRYWICTVEAMPRDLRVDFLAVDEIQLAAHPERGHVFTDRLLHCARPARDLVPGRGHDASADARARARGRRSSEPPRLSQLSRIGQSRSAHACRARSAVVAFCMPQVYELAERCAARAAARRWCSARSRRGRATRRWRCIRRARSTTWWPPTPSAWASTWTSTTWRSRDVRKFDGFEMRDLETPSSRRSPAAPGATCATAASARLSPEPELSPRLGAAARSSIALLRSSSPTIAMPRSTSTACRLAREPAKSRLYFARRNRALRLLGVYAAPDADDLLVLRVLAKRPEVSGARQRS